MKGGRSSWGGESRTGARTPGAWLGGKTALALGVSLILWLAAHHGQVAYALSTGGEGGEELWVGDPPQGLQDPVYWVYVVAESEDEGYVVRWDGKALNLEETIRVGMRPGETESPHGVHVSPHGDHWYVSIAHGFPRGYLRRFEIGSNRPTAQVELDMFPSSLTVDPTGLFVYVVNSNFHGDMVPSSVSVVFTPDMLEMARIETCTMPHGSRLNRSGSMHYSVCMMDDQLVELNSPALAVERRFDLSSGSEGLLPVDFTGHHGPQPDAHAEHHGHDAGTAHWEATCSPTWVQPSPDDRFAYVTCNRSGEVVEVDLGAGVIARRIPVPARPYNLDVTPDGEVLVVTHRRDPGEVTLWSRQSGALLATFPTGRSHTHGIAMTPDSRFAFVTSEGVRGESGVLEVIDLQALAVVARLDLGRQATGVAFWRMEGH